MKELIKGSFFPRDSNTLWIIREMEVLLGLESKDIDEMSYTELIEYIDQLALKSLKLL